MPSQRSRCHCNCFQGLSFLFTLTLEKFIDVFGLRPVAAFVIVVVVAVVVVVDVVVVVVIAVVAACQGLDQVAWQKIFSIQK